MCSRYIPSGSLCYIAASVTVYQSAIVCCCVCCVLCATVCAVCCVLCATVCASADICSRQHPLPLRLWQIDILGNILNLIKDQPGLLKTNFEHLLKSWMIFSIFLRDLGCYLELNFRSWMIFWITIYILDDI